MMMVLSIPLCGQSQGIFAGRGANIVMHDDAKLVLNDASFINHGSFIAGKSTVFFTSEDGIENAFIGGSAPIAFYNLSIQRAARGVQLENEVSITGVLAMQGGNLELNRHNINLGKTGSISGENIQSCITGKKGGTITVLADLRSPNGINPGNIGVALSTTADLGVTLITRGHVQQTNSYGDQGIHRYYDIKPSFSTNANIALRFNYLDGEIEGNNKSDLVVWCNTGEGWIAAGKDNTDASANTVVKTNLPALNRFTLGRSNAPNLTGAHVKTGTQKFMQVYPNPAQEIITAVVSSAQQAQRTILLQDQRGKTLEQKRITLRAGINTIRWNISKYSGGTYYLVFDDVGLGNIKIVKQ
jgi:hypothetical protein